MDMKIKQRTNDTRLCYGASCTWFGSIYEASSTDKHEVHQKLRAIREEHKLPNPSGDHGLPCCPHCGGMLYELPEERKWWLGIDVFEAGSYRAQELPRPHPGYRKMWEWQRDEYKKCFPTPLALAEAYKAASGIAVSVEP
jgi:hypothetical protein